MELDAELPRTRQRLAGDLLLHELNAQRASQNRPPGGIHAAAARACGDGPGPTDSSTGAEKT
jgi:hypothetical protein